MFQTDRRESGFSANDNAARSQPSSGAEVRNGMANKSVSRASEVNPPWLEKGLKAAGG